MKKQGRLMKSWKKRYFNLYNNGILTYSAEASGTKILGEIDIKCAKIEIQGDLEEDNSIPKSRLKRHASSFSDRLKKTSSEILIAKFDIKISTSNGSRVLKLRCDSNFDKQAWISALNRSSNLSLSVSGDQGLFIEIFWDLTNDENDFSDNNNGENNISFYKNEILLKNELLRNCIYCISFTTTTISTSNFSKLLAKHDDNDNKNTEDGNEAPCTLRRWSFIFTSEELFYDIFKSSTYISKCFSLGYKINRCNVGGKRFNLYIDEKVKLLIALFKLKNEFNDNDYHYNYVDNNIINIEPMSETNYILHPQAFFLPSKGTLIRRSYVAKRNDQKNILQIIQQIESSTAYVARADYPSVLCYHVYTDKIANNTRTRLNIIELYANNLALNTFLRDEQVVRLKQSQLSMFEKDVIEMERFCLYSTLVPPSNSYINTISNLGYIGNNITTIISNREDDIMKKRLFYTMIQKDGGYVLHQTPALPYKMTKSVGWMMKRRTKKELFRRRFFVINPDGACLMRYYLKSGSHLNGENERGSFSLEELIIYLHGGSRSLNFTLSSPKEPQTMSLKARTVIEYHRWIQDLTPYAKTIYNLDTETLITGVQPKKGLDTFNIDNIVISAIALQLDQINMSSNANYTKKKNIMDKNSLLSLDTNDNEINQWFLTYSAELNQIIAKEAGNAVSQTIAWFVSLNGYPLNKNSKTQKY